MIKCLMLLAFLPLSLNASYDMIERNLMYKSHEYFLEMRYISRSEREFLYKRGKMDAYNEVILMIEAENAKKEKRSN